MSAARGGGAGASPAKKQKIGAPATAVPVAAKDVKLLHSARAGDCAAIKAAIKAGAQVTFQVRPRCVPRAYPVHFLFQRPLHVLLVVI